MTPSLKQQVMNAADTAAQAAEIAVDQAGNGDFTAAAISIQRVLNQAAVTLTIAEVAKQKRDWREQVVDNANRAVANATRAAKYATEGDFANAALAAGNAARAAEYAVSTAKAIDAEAQIKTATHKTLAASAEINSVMRA